MRLNRSSVADGLTFKQLDEAFPFTEHEQDQEQEQEQGQEPLQPQMEETTLVFMRTSRSLSINLAGKLARGRTRDNALSRTFPSSHSAFFMRKCRSRRSKSSSALSAIAGFLLGGALRPIQSIFPLFVVLYGTSKSFGEMGPGVATCLCTSESFPTPLRGHYLGFAAAGGKAGAAVGTQVFTSIQNSLNDTFKGQQAMFLIGAGFALAGGLVSSFLIPDKEKDLESEDRRFRDFLAANGYDTSAYRESLVEQVKSTAFKKEVLT